MVLCTEMFLQYFIFFPWQGAILCFLSGWDEIIVVHDMLSSKIQDVSDFNLNVLSATKVFRKSEHRDKAHYRVPVFESLTR